MKEIAILGSTGSIGTQTLDIVRIYPRLFHVSVISAKRNIDALFAQAEEFHPHTIVVTDEEAGKRFKDLYRGSAEVLVGEGALSTAACGNQVDLVLVSVVGIDGLKPTLDAIAAGKEIALANKETLVTGGELVMRAAKEKGILIRPVDSEHSAIFQSMLGQDKKAVHKILLTASGGPFRGYTRKQLAQVTLEDAMKHPTWNMGRKVTLDSATMFNKGLEVIEARWLFDVDYDHIEVLVQPQSLIHSMVEYEDGAVIAQLGTADMRLPIQYALYYPNRLHLSGDRLDFWKMKAITLEEPDMETFYGLKLAYEACRKGGNIPTAFNAANERAVAMFLDGKIRFLEIPEIAQACMEQCTYIASPSVEEILATEQAAYEYIESRW